MFLKWNNLFSECYGAPFVKILYLTDFAQKRLSLRIFSYHLCAHLAISAQRYYLCADIAKCAQI